MGEKGKGDGELDDTAGCGMLYQRHSKSIDPKRMACGVCKGRLMQIRPAPRGIGARADGPEVQNGSGGVAEGGAGEAGGGQSETKPPTTQSVYQSFVKTHFKTIRHELGPASPMKDVMKEVGRRYRVMKEEQGKEVLVEKEIERLHTTPEVQQVKVKTKDWESGKDRDGEEQRWGREKMVEVIEILDSDDDDDDDVFEQVRGDEEENKEGREEEENELFVEEDYEEDAEEEDEDENEGDDLNLPDVMEALTIYD